MTFGRFDPDQRRAENAARRERNNVALLATRGREGVAMGGCTTGPVPKRPADRNRAVRALADGEECQVRYQLVCRGIGPAAAAYTIWAHTNTQADEKGTGYKGHDSAGMFSCDRCHEVIDRRLLPPIELEEVVRGAQERTRIRLRFIARDPAERPWRRRAAQWALDQLASREGSTA